MFMVNDQDARYRVKRVAYVFDGLMNMDNPRVCVQVRSDVKDKMIRGIQADDVLGSMFSVVEVGYESIGNGV